MKMILFYLPSQLNEFHCGLERIELRVEMTRFLAPAPQHRRNCGLFRTWLPLLTKSPASGGDNDLDAIASVLFCPLLSVHAQPPSASILDRFSALLRVYRRGMAAAEKSSFLGSLSPWSGVTRSTTPSPSPSKGPFEATMGNDEVRQIDHSISLRPSPSLRRYPKDCPPLKTKWFYAVDVPKRKPFAPDSATLAPPKKFVPFSTNDSQAIESAFQALGTSEDANPEVKPGTSAR